MVRAANTGISAIIDGYGRVQAMIDVGVEGAIDGDLPRSLAPTPYVKYRDAVPAGLAFLALFTAFIGRLGASRRKN
jgi:apolipoprotein N-acyltransferase